MQSNWDEASTPRETIDFGSIPVDTKVEKEIYIENFAKEPSTYRVSLMYILNYVDKVYKVSVDTIPIKPGSSAQVRILFQPNIVGQSFTEYYIVENTVGHIHQLIVTGKCCGPFVTLNKKKLKFKICKNLDTESKEDITMTNNTYVETIYQWILPYGGHGYFQISTGICGVIRAMETINMTVIFRGTALGMYTAEFTCLLLNQEPLFLKVIATVSLPGDQMLNPYRHKFHHNWNIISRFTHLMENSLTCLSRIPLASVFERYIDFGTGSARDITLNITQTLCVTNHGEVDGYMQWIPDPENIFIIDPVSSIIPPNESRLFSVRFRPKKDSEVYGYLMPGDFHHQYDEEFKIVHTWFHIPCTGNTWAPCEEWPTEWHCNTEITMPPTVPGKTTFTNFMLSNKLDLPMHYKFYPPETTNFAIMPMCGIVPSRGWQVITVAMEPKFSGNYYENWDLVINVTYEVRICLCGNAEQSHIEVMSHGYNPSTDALLEFQPTITGCCNYITAYIHNLTRMNIHLRVLNSVPWLGADNQGIVIIPPQEIIGYNWWFFPEKANDVYVSTATCSCVCLIDGRPVGEPNEVFIQFTGFSEMPDLRTLPKTLNLHDVVVDESASCTFTLYNNGTCYFTSKLYYEIRGMGDDHRDDTLEICSSVNTLKASNYCEVKCTVTPFRAGSRKIDIRYLVQYRDENNDLIELMSAKKAICNIYYDGIYPTMNVKRTISVLCPIILSNHCVWNITNVDALNKALEDVRPNNPLTVDLHAPDLCVRSGPVEVVMVLGGVHRAPAAWSVRREKICDCEMIQVQVGISLYEMRHTCIHRPLVELKPISGTVYADTPDLWYLKFVYSLEENNTLRYVLTMSHERVLYLDFHMYAHENIKGILVPLRRPVGQDEYLGILDCGKVPINNIDPVLRLLWLYNPTDVFTTWRLLKGAKVNNQSEIKCLLYFAEVAPLSRLPIPFAFLPTEMIDYECVFPCSFGYDTIKLLVKGQGGLPNCVETRMDIPRYVQKNVRNSYRNNVVYLSIDHLTLPILQTYSLSRDILAINNNTDHVMRFIWLPERIANVINIVMTPCWGVLQPKSSEWITMTVYTLQEPATFTTTVSCEILDLTARKEYQRNELLRKNKTERCNKEFIITEKEMRHPGINDAPPFVLDIEKPQPYYIALSVAVSSKGQRDGCTRMHLRQMWEQPPTYDLVTNSMNEGCCKEKTNANNLKLTDIIRIIDGILWDALHSTMFNYQIKYYSKEHIPTYTQLMKTIDSEVTLELSRRVTSGICDAIVNKAIYHVYGLNPKHEVSIFEA